MVQGIEGTDLIGYGTDNTVTTSGTYNDPEVPVYSFARYDL